MEHADMSIRPETRRVLGAVLAGGQSRRFGQGDKALAQLGGRTVLDHVIERARPQVDHLILNVNGDRARFARFNLEIVADETPGEGPLGGILAALGHAEACGFDLTATFPCDTPFFPRDLVARLGAALDTQGGDFAIAASEGREHAFSPCGRGRRARRLRALTRKECAVSATRQGACGPAWWTFPRKMAKVRFSISTGWKTSPRRRRSWSGRGGSEWAGIRCLASSAGRTAARRHWWRRCCAN